MSSIQAKSTNEPSSINHPKIIKTIFILDKNRRYSFDVNQNITIFLLKKMIDAAANLNNAHLRIFHEGTEYTSYDGSSLDILFPEKELIIFNLTVSFDSFDAYDNLISLKLTRNIVLCIFLSILIFIATPVVKVFVSNVLSLMLIKVMIIKKNMIIYNQVKN